MRPFSLEESALLRRKTASMAFLSSKLMMVPCMILREIFVVDLRLD